MALIDCKGCGNKISEYAKACPKCGLSQAQISQESEIAVPPLLANEPTKPVIESHISVQPKKKNYTKRIILFTLVTLSLVVGGLYIPRLFESSTESTTDSPPTKFDNTRTDFDNSPEAESDESESKVNENKHYEPEDEEEYELTPQDVENNLSAWVNVTYDYKQKLITGVHDIQIVVRNNSDFMLKSARVEVQYQRLNNKVFDREYVQFNSVAPHSSMTLYAPNKSEGSFVKCILLEGDVSKN